VAYRQTTSKTAQLPGASNSELRESSMPDRSHNHTTAQSPPIQKIGGGNAVAATDTSVLELNRGPVDARLKRLVRLLAQQAAEEFIQNASTSSGMH